MDSLPYPATRTPPIAPSRKILCACALVASALLLLPGAAAAAPGRLVHARLAQAGRKLIFSVRSRRPMALAGLQARPVISRAESRYLCLALSQPGGSGELRLCLGPTTTRLGSEQVNAKGRVTGQGSLRATVKRPSPNELVAAFVPADAGLAPRRYGWRAIASNGCGAGEQCGEALPARGGYGFRLRPVRPVGCSGGTPGLVTNGSRERKVVALTFDDGPSEYTPGFLQVLREKGIVGTFFEVGQEMPGREATMREILAQGSELGDHTMNHVEYPGYGQIAGAASRIEAYTHFKPCLFRPPGGAVNSSVVATAGSLGMRTITWDVDPRDWSTPGTAAIYSNIVGHAQPGSIILMHDGGGPRGETLEALPHIIDTLRARGYSFTTVSQLLGYHLIYKPYG
ncbi:MAG TPA: polysaccharide deacetylase family protein [Solirubrobacterales bacterium]|nr:polysaccharide deacetylase family protein [Solirubrobacterales bacterium]